MLSSKPGVKEPITKPRPKEKPKVDPLPEEWQTEQPKVRPSPKGSLRFLIFNLLDLIQNK